MKIWVGGPALLGVFLVGLWWNSDAGNSQLLQSKVWRVGFHHTSPFLFRHEDGEATGFARDVLDEAARRAGVRLEWVYIPEGAARGFSDGTIDLYPRSSAVAGMARAPHISRPWFESYYGLVSEAKRGRSEMPKVDGAVVLTGSTPFVQAFAKQRLPGAQLEATTGWPDAIERLCSGEGAAAFGDLREATVGLLSRPADCHNRVLRTFPLAGAAVPAGIGSTLAAAPVADALRYQIDHLAENGRLAELHSQWYLAAHHELAALHDAATQRKANRQWALLAAGLLVLLGALAALLVWTQRLRLAAVRAGEAKSVFMATISHELRTPMNGVLGMAQLLRESKLDGEQHQMVETIARSGRSLLKVINDVLDLSRLEAGKMLLARAPFSLSETVELVRSLLAVEASSKGIALVLEVDRELPDRYIGDGARTNQVLLNLAGNAVKFTSHGQVLIQVKRVPGGLRFSVTDTGIGIASATLKTLFEPFIQGEASATGGGGGTGLGLAISKRLVEAMGGEIGMESEPGKGTCCWFDVPVQPALAMAPPPSPPAPPARALRILLAEDNVVNQTVARRFLERQGHQVDVVTNGRQAVEACVRQRWDLILMDCQMPEMDGFTATMEIRRLEQALSRQTPIVALTANAHAEDRVRCLEAGMDGHVAKPLALEELASALERAYSLRA
jgi:signal transduction histidine kinase/ActR/RegA family two-component response regulator